MENTVKTIKAFVTSDNQLFKTEQEALDHERELNVRGLLKPFMRTIITDDVFTTIKNPNSSKLDVIEILTDKLATENKILIGYLGVEI